MNLKEGIVELIKKELSDKITLLKKEIGEIRETKNNETKSSAGDKFETTRAVLQNELDMKQSILHKATDQFYELKRIDFKKNSEIVDLGSLVETNNGIYLIAIGAGKFSLKGKIVYSISIRSPLAKQLQNQKKGHSFNINNIKYQVLKII